ncbi:N-acetyltransferase [Candidatus Woesearchaeota archaeon]|nr:GNAT family N-acetyltransferase [Candidatus Woesearchaeota archaeon]RLE40531.1 MAG: N-acetyltransferase [Candidatus Woesearchaeota archaeon]
MSKTKLEIEGERIKLRKLKLSDASDIYKNLQDREMVKWTLNIPWPYKRKDAIKFIRKTHYEMKKKSGYTFGIVLKEINKVIGVVSLIHINQKDKNAELGYWLGKKYWGKGLMTEAVKLMLKFAFEKLKLHRVYAGVFEENIASRRVLEKTGFKLEGVMRECRYKYNQWHNELRFSILKQEYNQ